MFGAEAPGCLHSTLQGHKLLVCPWEGGGQTPRLCLLEIQRALGPAPPGAGGRCGQGGEGPGESLMPMSPLAAPHS